MMRIAVGIGIVILLVGLLILLGIGRAWQRGEIWTDTPPDGTYSFTDVEAGNERDILIPVVGGILLLTVIVMFVAATAYDNARERLPGDSNRTDCRRM